MNASSARRTIIARMALAIGVLLVGASIVVCGYMYWCSHTAHTEPTPNVASGTAEEAYTFDDGFPVVDWDYWIAINPDVIGWISIPNTTVSYPIVQAPANDPDYYLNHDVYRKYNPLGAIYLDAACALDGLASDNAAIFGHHISFGEAMFAPVASYTDSAFAQEHATIQIQTPNERRTLKVMAAAAINGASKTKRTEFSDREDFRAWYLERIAEAQVVMDPTVPVRTTSLITCSYHTRNERTVVYAAAESDIPLNAIPIIATATQGTTGRNAD